MKPKSGLSIKKIGKNYIVVRASSDVVNATEVFNMNETAARLWERMKTTDCSIESLADWLCEVYEVDRDTALADVTKQLEVWMDYGLLES